MGDAVGVSTSTATSTTSASASTSTTKTPPATPATTTAAAAAPRPGGNGTNAAWQEPPRRRRRRRGGARPRVPPGQDAATSFEAFAVVADAASARSRAGQRVAPGQGEGRRATLDCPCPPCSPSARPCAAARDYRTAAVDAGNGQAHDRSDAGKSRPGPKEDERRPAESNGVTMGRPECRREKGQGCCV